MKVAIVDDEIVQLEQIVDEVKKWQKDRKCAMNIQTFQNGKGLLNHCAFTDYAFDVFLLDMQMEEMNGLQLGKEVRTMFPESIIIYITNYLEPVCESFKVGAFRYILKANLSIAIGEALDSAEKCIVDNDKYFQYSYKKQDVRIAYNKIIYFESSKRIIRMVLAGGEVKEFYGKISDIEKKIPDKVFVRCHQSFIVNARFIESVEGRWIQLKDNSNIPISDKHVNAIENAIMWSER